MKSVICCLTPWFVHLAWKQARFKVSMHQAWCQHHIGSQAHKFEWLISEEKGKDQKMTKSNSKRKTNEQTDKQLKTNKQKLKTSLNFAHDPIDTDIDALTDKDMIIKAPMPSTANNPGANCKTSCAPCHWFFHGACHGCVLWNP